MPPLLIFGNRRYLETSLETSRRIHWSEEGIAYAHFRLAKILHELGEHDEAAMHKSQAEATRNELLKMHPEYLEECPHDDSAIYDQMIPIWSGRCSYRTKTWTALNVVEVGEEQFDLVEDVSYTIEEI